MNVSKHITQWVKKANRVVITVLFCLFALSTIKALTKENHILLLNKQSANKNLVEPSARFDRIWVDYDVTEDGQKGMRIHVQFTIYGMKDRDSYLAVYFENDKKMRLKDNNGKMRSTDGDVAVYRSLKPGYDSTEYKDLSVFMPYTELDLGNGNWNLQMDVDLIYQGGGLIQHLAFKEFNYKLGGDVVANKSSVSATVKKIWVDYDVTRNGKKGLLVHVNFEVTGLKGIASKLVARVQKENSEFLANNNAGYSNDSNQLEISSDMKPGYAIAVYEDATLFLPYSEIIVSKGVWDLKLDIDLNYENGDLVQHLDLYKFKFTR